MKIPPIQQKINPSFGIYQKTIYSCLGECNTGKYKDYNIKIYTNKYDRVKLFYISDKFTNWILSKLIYFQNNVKKTRISKPN